MVSYPGNRSVSMTGFSGIDMATSFPNLITVDRRLAKPLYKQIYDSFRTRIVRAELRAGQPGPSSRELARELRISRLPVLNAYAQLLAEGYFESRVGAGTFVAASFPTRAADDSITRDARRKLRTISTRASALPPYERPTWAEHLGA